MQLHIKQLHDPSVLPAEDDERGAEINNAYNADLQKWKLLRSVISSNLPSVLFVLMALEKFFIFSVEDVETLTLRIISVAYE